MLRPAASILALCGALAAAPASAQEGEGKRLFETVCASCHGEARIVGALRTMPRDERLPYLRSFVPTHHYMDAGERELIIKHLSGRAGS